MAHRGDKEAGCDSGHSHLKPPGSSTHVPLLWHGLDIHSSRSVSQRVPGEQKKNEDQCFIWTKNKVSMAGFLVIKNNIFNNVAFILEKKPCTCTDIAAFGQALL